MEIFGKDKLLRLDEERQRRRQQRAEEATRRLEQVGKQTLQAVKERPEQSKNSGESPVAEGSARRPGALSRVLLEAATSGEDARGSKRRGKRDVARRADGHAALRQIDQAMSAIHGALADAPGAGLMN